MNPLRRQLLKAGAVLSSVMLLPKNLFAARPDEAFASDIYEQALIRLFGRSDVQLSEQVSLSAPDIAENGAVVPLSISSTLAEIDTIAVFIKDNPNPLTASFEMGPGAIADISTRVKMGKSSIVQAVVRSQGKLYGSEKEVKVTIGGCGG
jgi:sulfur-oxidizing protein SoxY